jgi:hypothetical protein
MEHKAFRVCRVPRATKEIRVFKERRGRRVLQEQMEHKAFRVCRVPRATKEIRVFKGHRGHKALKEIRASKAFKECRAFRVCRAQESKEYKDSDFKVYKETKE